MLEGKAPQQPQFKIDFSKAQDLFCECGNDVYNMAYKFKKLSKLVSPTGQETVIPIQIFRCTECGNEHEDLMSDM